jgi:hypothetical protein
MTYQAKQQSKQGTPHRGPEVKILFKKSKIGVMSIDMQWKIDADSLLINVFS